MRGINRIIVGGNLGAKPELQEFDSGSKRARFTIYTTRRFRGKDWKEGDELSEDTTRHSVVVWGPQADTCVNYLDKGSPVIVMGEQRHDGYTDRDGNKRITHFVRAQDVTLLPNGKGVVQQEEDGEVVPFQPQTVEGEPAGDAPF